MSRCMCLSLSKELVNITGRCLDSLSSLPKSSCDFDTITAVYADQAEAWLKRYKAESLAISNSTQNDVSPKALQYMTYLGDFYVSCLSLSAYSCLEC